MIGKRGKGPGGLFWGVLIAIVVILFIFSYYSNFSILPWNAFKDNLGQGYVGYETVFGDAALKPLNYIFGQIPNYLINLLGNGSGDSSTYISAAIVMMAMFTMFLLAFGDILRLFSLFSPAVSWITAALMAIIAANLRLMSSVSIYLLTLLSAFGALSVLFALGSVFVMFLMFHFGLGGIREKLILRRAEDEALKAVAGGKVAASGVKVLQDIADKASGKKPGMY